VGVGVGQLAELPAEGDLLGVADLLVPEEHHPPPVEGAADGLHGGVVEGPGEVDAADLGAGATRQRADLDAGRVAGPLSFVVCHIGHFSASWTTWLNRFDTASS
jgi:hypothetical protein